MLCTELNCILEVMEAMRTVNRNVIDSLTPFLPGKPCSIEKYFHSSEGCCLPLATSCHLRFYQARMRCTQIHSFCIWISLPGGWDGIHVVIPSPWNNLMEIKIALWIYKNGGGVGKQSRKKVTKRTEMHRNLSLDVSQSWRT